MNTADHVGIGWVSGSRKNAFCPVGEGQRHHENHHKQQTADNGRDSTVKNFGSKEISVGG